MNNEDNTQMDEFGITSTTESTYHYKNYKYKKLSDAVNYAKSDTQKIKGTSEHNSAGVSKDVR